MRIDADRRNFWGETGTEMENVPVIPLDVTAVIVAFPAEMAFTSPFGETAATPSSLEDQVTVLSVVLSGSIVAVSCIEWLR